jgi:hypothetical protein
MGSSNKSYIGGSDSCTGYLEYPFQKYADDGQHADLLLLKHYTGNGQQAGKELLIFERISN